MQLSAQLAAWLSAVFGLACLGAAIDGFSEASAIADAVEREAQLSYAWFWTFLAIAAGVVGALSWMIAKGKLGPAE
jgi:hypothetical protein